MSGKKEDRLTPQDPEVLNAEQAAAVLGVSRRLTLRLAREGKIPGKKLGKEWRFRRAALLRSLGEPDLTRPIGESPERPAGQGRSKETMRGRRSPSLERLK